MQPPETQRADCIARRKLLRRLMPLAGLGLLTATGLVVWLNAIEGAGAPTPCIAAFAVLCVTSALLVKPLRKLWRVGRDARQQQRFPPIGLAVIRDTRVRHGDAAQRQGKRLQDLAVLMTLFVVALPIAVGWLLFS